MDNKQRPNPKTTKDSSWTDENDKLTNPNRRQEEENVESPSRGGQRGSERDPGSTESRPSDRRDPLDDREQVDTSRKQRQSTEE